MYIWQTADEGKIMHNGAIDNRRYASFVGGGRRFEIIESMHNEINLPFWCKGLAWKCHSVDQSFAVDVSVWL